MYNTVDQMVENSFEDGIQVGMDVGMDVGIKEGRLEVVLDLLQDEFGVNKDKWRGRLKEMSSEELRAFTHRIVHAFSEEELK